MYKTGKHLYEPFNKRTLTDKIKDFVNEHKKGLIVSTAVVIFGAVGLYEYLHEKKDMKPYYNALKTAIQEQDMSTEEKHLKDYYLEQFKNE